MNQKGVISFSILVQNTFYCTSATVKFLRQLFNAMIFSGRYPDDIPRSYFRSSFHIAKVLQRIFTLVNIKLIVESPAPYLDESLSYCNDFEFQCTKWRKAYLCRVKNITTFLNPDPYNRPCINLFGAQEKKTTVSPIDTQIKNRKENGKYTTLDTNSLLGNYARVCIETLDLEAYFIFCKPKSLKEILILTLVGVSLKIKMVTG